MSVDRMHITPSFGPLESVMTEKRARDFSWVFARRAVNIYGEEVLIHAYRTNYSNQPEMLYLSEGGVAWTSADDQCTRLDLGTAIQLATMGVSHVA